MLLKTEEILGQEVQLEVDARTGHFSSSLNGETLVSYADTLDGLMNETKKTLSRQRVKVAVPIRTTRGVHGIVTGKHSGNGHFVVKYGKDTAYIDKYRGTKETLRGDTPNAVIQRLAEIIKEMTNLKTEQARLLKEHHIDLEAALNAAIETELAKKDASA